MPPRIPRPGTATRRIYDAAMEMIAMDRLVSTAEIRRRLPDIKELQSYRVKLLGRGLISPADWPAAPHGGQAGFVHAPFEARRELILDHLDAAARQEAQPIASYLARTIGSNYAVMIEDRKQMIASNIIIPSDWPIRTGDRLEYVAESPCPTAIMIGRWRLQAEWSPICERMHRAIPPRQCEIPGVSRFAGALR